VGLGQVGSRTDTERLPVGGMLAVVTESMRNAGIRSLGDEVVQKSAANSEALSKLGVFAMAHSLSAVLALVVGAVYGDRLSAKSSRGHVVFLLPALAASLLLAHYLVSPHAGWTTSLAAIGYGSAIGLFSANLHAAVLDVTPERHWARGVALLAALQTLTPVFVSYAYSWLRCSRSLVGRSALTWSGNQEAGSNSAT